MLGEVAKPGQNAFRDEPFEDRFGGLGQGQLDEFEDWAEWKITADDFERQSIASSRRAQPILTINATDSPIHAYVESRATAVTSHAAASTCTPSGSWRPANSSAIVASTRLASASSSSCAINSRTLDVFCT